jgi:hypothetical protein
MKYDKYTMGILAFAAAIAIGMIVSTRSCAAEAAPPQRSCSSELLGGDSAVFRVDGTDLGDANLATQYEGTRNRIATAISAKKAVEYYVRQRTSFGLVCDIDIDLAVRADPEACRRLNPKSPMSMACYLESKLGYFLVNKDYFEMYNITFVRWDG